MKTILVIDDVEEISKTFSLVFPEFNFINAGSIETGLGLIASEKEIILVFLDYRLPEGDGITCLKEIKSKYHSLPVVMMSGMSSIMNQAMAEGADGFIEKPFDFDDIQEILWSVMDEKVKTN